MLTALIKKKRKYFSFKRKFTWYQLQSHIWGRASLYMRKCANIYSYEGKAVSHIWLCNRSRPNSLMFGENLIFFFNQCSHPHYLLREAQGKPWWEWEWWRYSLEQGREAGRSCQGVVGTTSSPAVSFLANPEHYTKKSGNREEKQGDVARVDSVLQPPVQWFYFLQTLYITLLHNKSGTSRRSIEKLPGWTVYNLQSRGFVSCTLRIP